MTSMPPSLWARTAIAGPECPPLTSAEECDTVIVGAGYTGCSAALHLAREGRAVRVLEAAEPGWGCSGRNGGQVNPGGNRATPDEVIEVLGKEWGERFIAMGHETCDLVFELIDRYRIDCDALRPGYVQGGWGNTGVEYERDWVTQWSARGVEARLLDANEIRELIGSDHYDHGLFDPRGGNVQPLSYARGLAHAAIAEGAVVHGASKAIRIERSGKDWRVAVEGGATVTARHVLIGSNGYTDDLWPGLRRSVVPVCSFVAATAPLGHNVLPKVLPGRHAVSESGRVIVYYRLDRDGRFVIGGHGNLFNVDTSGDDSHVRAVAEQLYPELSGVEWEYHWAGWPAMTKTHLPMLVGLAPGVYAGLGYNGRGVATATMMGKQLALAVLGETPALRVEPLPTFALHPLRQIGISYRLIVGSWLDGRPRRKAA